MGRHTLEGNPPIDVTLRRSSQARRMTLRVSRLDGRVTLTLPPRSPQREAVAFLRAREEWLRGHLQHIAPVHDIGQMRTVPFRGQLMTLVTADVKRARLGDDAIFVRGERPVGAQVKAMLRLKARDALSAASDLYASRVGRTYTSLSIRDTRSRWGSCSSKGVLMYSWRLIMAPPDILQYVAAHEVAHLVEMNHSAAFWSVVEDIFPDYRRCRTWLRENGDQLHRVAFND